MCVYKKMKTHCKLKTKFISYVNKTKLKLLFI